MDRFRTAEAPPAKPGEFSLSFNDLAVCPGNPQVGCHPIFPRRFPAGFPPPVVIRFKIPSLGAPHFLNSLKGLLRKIKELGIYPEPGLSLARRDG